MVKILAIESSCDETAAAVVADGTTVLSNIIFSQADLHSKYGGVVPEVASRLHIECIDKVVDEALKEAHTALEDIDAVAVTFAPGLIGSLLVGLSYAKALAYASNKPLIGVHHIEGHICANYLNGLTPPFVCLVASGGHSHIIKVSDYRNYEILGKTRDDAAGEAFDKVARVLGLGYPGGPNVDKAARNGTPCIPFKKPDFNDGTLDFSFSGIKTAVINYVHNAEQKGEEVNKNDLAASFQKTVVELLSENTFKAAKQSGVKKVALAGGVASNSALREEFQRLAQKNNMEFFRPDPIFCTDNAAMIGAAAYHYYVREEFSDLSLNAKAYLPINFTQADLLEKGKNKWLSAKNDA
ncbi:MAG: tRNA (adenosine(37)-N6)-threonylcarbamoyltransferase complex transferase subunit TsaD [Clostridia bacterium]|nr:tRNA (adenosine(37)-N6)-threonylcarbamoyltransferase complex transferase subunit TsaD [Clostridia bacterium]